MKSSVFCSAMMKPIHDIFGGQIKIMLITRHIKPCLISFAKVQKPGVQERSSLEDTKEFWHTSIGLPYTENFEKFHKSIDKNLVTMTQLTVLGYGAVVAGYLLNKEIYSHFVVYEKLMKNVQEEAKTLFKKLDLPLEYVTEALTALNKHSQGNVFGSSDENKETLIEDWEGVDTIFKQLDVPFRVNMNIDDMTKIMNSS